MNIDCEECGTGIGLEKLYQTFLGVDVVGLFPAIKFKSTGKIIRKTIQKSKIILHGMNWRQAARYILMNRNLTSDLAPIRKFLPWKRARGNIPSMKNRAVNDKKEGMVLPGSIPNRNRNESAGLPCG